MVKRKLYTLSYLEMKTKTKKRSKKAEAEAEVKVETGTVPDPCETEWSLTIHRLKPTLPHCGERDLKLDSPKEQNVRKMMCGSWFHTKRFITNNSAVRWSVSIVALDPGTEVFQTSYGTDGVVSMWSEGGLEQLKQCKGRHSSQFSPRNPQETHTVAVYNL